MSRLLLLLIASLPLLPAEILIVADEIPAMQVLAAKLPKPSAIVEQSALPHNLAAYSTVIVYIHKDITPAAEHTFIDYAQNGGRLVLLHHSISSGKRKNKDWLPFLGVTLPEGSFESGGYKYIDSVNFDIVNLAPGNPVTRDITVIPARDTEIYLNHVLTGERTILLGLRFTDPKSGRVYEQPTAAWRRVTGRGDVFYFMAGHNARDFEIPAYAALIARAVR